MLTVGLLLTLVESSFMNKISRILGLAGLLALGASETSWALNYTDQDLLLVFRNPNGKDLICDLGSVSNYLGHADGFTQTVVAKYDKSVPIATYGDLTAGPLFALIASTPSNSSQKRIWTSVGSTDANPLELTSTTLALVISKITNVGRNANSATASSATNVWTIDGSDKLSYTGVMTGNGTVPAGADTLGAYLPYTISSPIVGTVRFFEITSSTASPKPDAKQIGSFSVDADGTLTFTAGAGGTVVITTPVIAGITRNGTLSTISVPSQSGVNYRLRYFSGGLTTSPTSTWTPGPTVAGTGSSLDLTDDSTDSARVYVVEAFQ